MAATIAVLVAAVTVVAIPRVAVVNFAAAVDFDVKVAVDLACFVASIRRAQLLMFYYSPGGRGPD